MFALKPRQDSPLLSDASILAEIWKTASRYNGIRSSDTDSFAISVERGFVLLTGHVRTKYHHDLIEEIACSTPGVNAVRNDLVVDSDLTIQVAQVLSKDERTRHFILPVGCTNGWIHLGGTMPGREFQIAAEEIAAQVPAVRGVLSRPLVTGEYPEVERWPIQPRIQAKMYDYNTQEGVVTQVVIQPRNRLVTHAVISINDFQDDNLVVQATIVPVEAMEVVNQESIILKRNGPPLNTFPIFEPSDYPPAPLDWRPPYPYSSGDVRWPREPHAGTEDRSSSSQSHRMQG